MPKKYFSKKETVFSIVVLTFNEEKNIGSLINKVNHLTNNYKSEILIIDSGSTDKTTIIIEQFQKKTKNLKLVKIKRESFNFGETRNLAVRYSQGKYILFISADAMPVTSSTFDLLIEDFQSDRRVVAVFGKHVPYQASSIITRLDISNRYSELEANVDRSGIFIQSKSHHLYNPSKLALLCFISNVFCCYYRDFLIEHPFKKVIGCEDLIIGKEIIDNGLIKIFDSRFSVMHSHSFGYLEYFRQQKMEFAIAIKLFKRISSNNLTKKFKIVIKSKDGIFNKIDYLIQLYVYYFIKLVAYLYTKLFNKIETS